MAGVRFHPMSGYQLGWVNGKVAQAAAAAEVQSGAGPWSGSNFTRGGLLVCFCACLGRQCSMIRS